MIRKLAIPEWFQVLWHSVIPGQILHDVCDTFYTILAYGNSTWNSPKTFPSTFNVNITDTHREWKASALSYESESTVVLHMVQCTVGIYRVQVSSQQVRSLMCQCCNSRSASECRLGHTIYRLAFTAEFYTPGWKSKFQLWTLKIQAVAIICSMEYSLQNGPTAIAEKSGKALLKDSKVC